MKKNKSKKWQETITLDYVSIPLVIISWQFIFKNKETRLGQTNGRKAIQKFVVFKNGLPRPKIGKGAINLYTDKADFWI